MSMPMEQQKRESGGFWGHNFVTVGEGFVFESILESEANQLLHFPLVLIHEPLAVIVRGL